MSNAIVANVYRYVIDEVINQVRGDFEDMGIDESVLQELQRSWESKVARSRVANFGFMREENFYDEEHPEQALNGHENDENETSQTILQYPNQEYQEAAPSAASLAALAASSSRAQHQQQSQQQQPQQQQPQQQQPQQQQPQPQQQQQHLQPNFGLPPPPRMMTDPLVNQYHLMHPPLNNPIMQPPNLNNIQNNGAQNNYNEPQQSPGNPRPNLPQNDGTYDESHMTTEQIDQQIEDTIMSNQDLTAETSETYSESMTFSASSFSGEPISLESLPDSVKELMKDAKKRAVRNQVKSRKIPQLDGEQEDEASAGGSGAGDEDITSDLDDPDDQDDEGEGGEEIEHIILCLYDKVTRTKNKWKCVLKDGIMLVNGRDYLFHRATGDFEW
ncbi:transcription factor IIA, alpha/beta subunit [Sporodiniella umbellata]|nr:transcription factor IIA, alpha/beta subunit [Sporodiniella umbellata]